MVLEEVLKSLFVNLNVSIKNDADLQKCLDICNTHSLEEKMFINMWQAFCAQRSFSLYPYPNRMVMFESDLVKKIESHIFDKKKKIVQLMAQDAPKIKETKNEVDSILEMYGCSSASIAKNKRLRSPEGESQGNETQKLRAVESTPSTDTIQPVTPTRQPVTAHSGKIVLKFGADVTSWKMGDDDGMEVQIIDNMSVPANATYMFDILSRKGPTLTALYQEFGERLMKLWSNKSGVYCTINVETCTNSAYRTYGMINYNQSTKAVMLESCRKPVGSKETPTVLMDLNAIKQYSFYSGQIVAVEGTNITGLVLHVTDIFTKGYAEKSPPPQLTKNLNIMVAAGPFTAHDNLIYQPLWDLMYEVKKEEPDVLILIGPFLEYTHPEFRNASIKYTFQEFFEMLIKNIVDQVKGTSIQVILVPSNRDVHHEPVYPTPPFVLPSSLCIPNIQLVSDPCILNIRGLTIGITSVDSLRHLSSADISNMPAMDRLGRLADHILSQTCFYPLNPPAEELNIDSVLFEQYAVFDVQPHIMILPSDMQCFCKMVNEAFILNPHRLQKHIYARMCVRPSSHGEWSVSNDISCEITKV